jgi:hypothetical protein
MTRSLAVAMALQAALFAVIGLLVLDMRAHNRVEELGGVNVWGYRGTELGRKPPHHIRIVAFGGDLAFGWGVKPVETLPSYAARLVSIEINRSGQPSRPITATIAAARGMRVGDYAEWIRRFSYLEPDIICLIPDEPEHQLDPGRFLPDRGSLMFALTGYSPILPLVLREKAALAHSTLLAGAARLLDAADLQAGPAPDQPAGSDDSLRSALDAAQRAAAIGVVLILPPRWIGTTPALPDGADRIRVVRLGDDAALSSPDLRLDGYHFSANGHSLAAGVVAPAMLDLIRTAERLRR